MMEYPSNKPDSHNIEKLLICLDYPGKVLNFTKAIATLGGYDELSKIFSGSKKNLEIRYSPENVYCRKALGEKSPGTGILLKVRFKKGSKHLEETNILGIVQETYQFNNLMDYNYMTLQKVKGNIKCIYENIVPSDSVSANFTEENKNVPLFLPPTIFSRIDNVQTNLFKKQEYQEGLSMDPAIDSSQEANIIGVNRSKRKSYATCVAFSLTEEIPGKPHEAAFDSISLKVVSQEKINAVKEMFKVRPIWTRLGLIENSKISADNVKSILPIVAYYYSSGPWRTCWIRFGYDPRKDFEARKYQPIDFRYKGGPGMNIDSRKKKDRLSNKHSASSMSSIFTIDSIPETKLTFFQYCDVHVLEIEELLKNISSFGVVCDEKRGWLPIGFQEKCREIMSEIVKNNFKKVYQRETLDFTVAEDESGETGLDDDEYGFVEEC